MKVPWLEVRDTLIILYTGVNMENNKIELPKLQPQQMPNLAPAQMQQNVNATNTGVNTQQGLANMFANTGQQVQAGRVQGQQGLAGMLGNYRGMWQPNGGSNYQVLGGVENLI